MYIQENGGAALPFTVPKGYSGNAFQEPPQAPPVTEAPPPSQEGAAPPPAEEAAAPVSKAATTAEAPPDTPVSALGRLPFLSSLLPPPRKKREGGLPEWALVALIFFVLNDSREGDLRPILLLLLLWD